MIGFLLKSSEKSSIGFQRQASEIKDWENSALPLWVLSVHGQREEDTRVLTQALASSAHRP